MVGTRKQTYFCGGRVYKTITITWSLEDSLISDVSDFVLSIQWGKNYIPSLPKHAYPFSKAHYYNVNHHYLVIVVYYKMQY